MDTIFIPMYLIIFLYGIIIGSFLNVCIYRIPKKENIVKVRSHCMKCNHQLQWYELIPLFSYLFLGGKCRKCKTKLSTQYPLIEGTNGVLYVFIFMINGFNVDSLLYCLLTSALLVLSVIDFRTFEIPVGINYFIFALGVVRTAVNYSDWLNHVIGFFAVSAVLWLIILVSGGKALGGGDMKLMATCGLFLGWKEIILAFLLGCIIGSVIHVIRMKVSGCEHVLAMGPYLAIGVFFTMLWGGQLLEWYLGSVLLI